MGKDVFEFRGVDNLVYAPVLIDDIDQFVCGTVKPLSHVAEIGRTTATNSETHYYDNNPLIVINSTGADEIKLTIVPLDLETQGEITGQEYDSVSGSLIEGEIEPRYFAIGYRTKGTDGKYRYVWRYKGKFGVPDETNATENDGTDTNNTELTFTGVATIHKFTRNKKKVAKAMVCDERYGRVDFDQWFDQVVTPDNITEIVTSKGVAVPVIYPSVSTFEGSAKVSLVSEDGDKIKYTTDGTSPVLGGTEYTAPFSISETTTVKAVAVRGEETSAVVEKSFVKLS